MIRLRRVGIRVEERNVVRDHAHVRTERRETLEQRELRVEESLARTFERAPALGIARGYVNLEAARRGKLLELAEQIGAAPIALPLVSEELRRVESDGDVRLFGDGAKKIVRVD